MKVFQLFAFLCAALAILSSVWVVSGESYVGSLGSAGTGDGQFNQPQGITIDPSGNIYVIDWGNARVEKFTSAGVFVGWLGPCGTGYNCDSTSHFSIGFTCTAATCTLGALGQFPRFAVASDPSGNLWFSTSAGPYYHVWEYTGSGQYITVLPDEFSQIAGIALDSLGNWSLTQFLGGMSDCNSSGSCASCIFAGASGMDGGVAADLYGNVYVADQGNNEVFWETHCHELGVFGSSGSLPGQFNKPYGVALDSFGNVFVVDQGNNRVEKFSRSGVFLDSFGSAGSGVAQLASPTYDAVDSYGNVYVVDTGNNRVEIFGSPLVSVVRGSDSSLYWSSRNYGSWAGWRPINGTTSSGPVLCSPGVGSLELIVRGSDNHTIYHRSFVNGVWSPNWDSPTGGSTIDQPACAVLNNVLYLVVRGGGDSLWYNTLPLPSGAWKGWAPLNESTPSAPVITLSQQFVNGKLGLNVWIRGENNEILSKSFTNGVWSNNWNVVAGSTPSAPTAVDACLTFQPDLSDACIFVAVRGQDNGVYVENGGAPWVNLNGTTLSSPILVKDLSGNLHIFVVGADGQIYHKFRSASALGRWSSSWDTPNWPAPGLSGINTPAIAAYAGGVELLDTVPGANGMWQNLVTGSSWHGWGQLGGSTLSTPAALIAS